ncbi:hypothetical protein Ancab_006787 [Ancistrocladus abbreviatus]
MGCRQGELRWFLSLVQSPYQDAFKTVGVNAAVLHICSLVLRTMETKLLNSLIIASLCIGLLLTQIQRASAQQQPFLLPHPFLMPPGGGNVIHDCLTALMDVPGCIAEFWGTIFQFPIGGFRPPIVGLGPGGVGPPFSIGRACCKAISDLNAKCWAKLFPFNPFMPQFFFGQCSQVAGGGGRTRGGGSHPPKD